MTMTIIDALHRIANHRQSLSREEACGVMAEVLAPVTDAQLVELAYTIARFR